MTATRQNPTRRRGKRATGGSAKRILLIPGLFYLRWTMMPLRRTLRKRGFDAEIWSAESRVVPLEHNVEQLAADISAFAADGRPLGLVTHSLGDWVARGALQQLPHGRVDRMVSLAPVMAASRAAWLAKPLFGRWLPAFATMSDPAHARQAIPLPPWIAHLIIWPRLNLVVTRVALEPDSPDLEMALWGTHTLMLVQPAVHRATCSFLASASGEHSV